MDNSYKPISENILINLTYGLNDESSLCREACVEALGNIGNPDALGSVEVISQKLTDYDASVREKAC